jgi:glycerol-3-phosphate dehydrogenase
MLKNDGLAMEENAEFNANRVSCRRFGTLSMEEKNEMIKADPAFGHLICRCETVTEGEILLAIRQNPPARSIDAVKRRTRAGMGRCQGGFCTTFITELLAKEQGIDETKVTKFGGGSYMLCGKTK